MEYIARQQKDVIYRFVKYCMSMVELLLHHGVQPTIVLDGDRMPAKAVTEQQRNRCAF